MTTRPDPCISPRERRARDGVLDAVRKTILRRNLKASDIYWSANGRKMSTADRARILRGEYERFSLRKSFLIADAVGVDNLSLFRAIMPHVAPGCETTQAKAA